MSASSSDREPTPDRVRLRVAYLGGAYHGWQIQPSVPTVQGELTRALSRLVGRDVKLWGASRTDAGVHALDQCCAFDDPGSRTTDELFRACNRLTPVDIRVLAVERTAPDFHPRHSARGKRYRYRICNSFGAHPFDLGRSWHVPRPLDVDAMNDACRWLVGTHDFTSLRARGCQADSPVRELFGVSVRRGDWGRVEVEVVGSAFLKYMVRNLVGTLIEVGVGRKPPEWVRDAIAARQRAAAGQTAPPEGLVLEKIFYPDHPWGTSSSTDTPG